MALKFFPIAKLANPNEVTGISASPPGNDQALKALLLAVENRHKSSRWGHRISTYLFDRTYPVGGGETQRTRYVYGKPSQGPIWVKNIHMYVGGASDDDTDTDNYATVQMYKSSSSTARVLTPVDNIGTESATSAHIVPPTRIRTIRGVDDNRVIQIPIQMGYIARSELWAFKVKTVNYSNSSGSHSPGWFESTLIIQFAELHTT